MRREIFKVKYRDYGAMSFYDDNTYYCHDGANDDDYRLWKYTDDLYFKCEWTQTWALWRAAAGGSSGEADIVIRSLVDYYAEKELLR